jgi:hypothetical protein
MRTLRSENLKKFSLGSHSTSFRRTPPIQQLYTAYTTTIQYLYTSYTTIGHQSDINRTSIGHGTDFRRNNIGVFHLRDV